MKHHIQRKTLNNLEISIVFKAFLFHELEIVQSNAVNKKYSLDQYLFYFFKKVLKGFMQWIIQNDISFILFVIKYLFGISQTFLQAISETKAFQ